MEDNPTEQAKHDEDLPMRGFRDTAQWLVGLGNADRSQVYALLYIGDQVKALVELHREIATQAMRLIGDLMPARVEMVPPKVSDVDPALFGYVPHRVDIDPTALHMPTVEFVRELLERYDQRRDGFCPEQCQHDPICRAITEANR